jgi:hypothetical protein
LLLQLLWLGEEMRAQGTLDDIWYSVVVGFVNAIFIFE